MIVRYGNKLVLINDIRFKGKRKIDWENVRLYLQEYVGAYYEIEESSEIVYIGNEFPEEFTESESRKALMGANVKAKANAAAAIPELIQIASNPSYEKNRKEKHVKKAKNGWYKLAYGVNNRKAIRGFALAVSIEESANKPEVTKKYSEFTEIP